MSEKKRFMMKKCGNDFCTFDSMNDNTVVSVCDVERIEQNTCDLLNELSEKNEQLKSENSMLRTTISRNEVYIQRMTQISEWK